MASNPSSTLATLPWSYRRTTGASRRRGRQRPRKAGPQQGDGRRVVHVLLLSICTAGFVGGGNRGSTLRSVGEAGKLLEAGLDRTPGALAAGDDQDRVVPRDRPDDLLPARPVDRETQRLRAARRRLDDEQRPHPIHGDEHRGEELLQVRADAGAALERRRVMGAPVGGGDLGEAKITDIPRQRRLGDGEALPFEQLAQLFLARDPSGADDLENRGVPLRFHGA